MLMLLLIFQIWISSDFFFTTEEELALIYAFLVSTCLPSVIFQPHHANFSFYYQIFIFQEISFVLQLFLL